ncbi:HpcH/HpaI aldolase/citrate lyase family protein [Cellulomonas cellasea]|uniref:Citrate lyase subunit beta n=2 Tax=Cellulomonas cellasea TaxID=43670 RepID=A0A0A0B6S4_9CELL|nr:CoA ester lyase [Cellulomonas cellasea]KGM02550.1 citrate lyase subunit beta [Cellulomonas cellasea DSM 20118]GEA88888.1 citrate lyase subunit beta-like protein [Cellulomonas cellasea]
MTARTLGPALLFCPADRPDRYAKAAERSDAVVLDLEDAVAPSAKAAARAALVDTPLDPARTVVRVNAAGTADLDADLDALRRTAYRTVMLPKTASAADLDALEGFATIALVETAAGVLHAAEIAAVPHVVALHWGADDLVASLGGTASRHPDGRWRHVALHARSTVLVAAGAHGKPAYDAVHMDIGDLDGLAREAADAAASGFVGTACVHPSQVAVVRAAFRPDDAAVERARRLLDAASRERGVFRFAGRMVDGPVLAHAREVLRRAGSTEDAAPRPVQR